MTEEEKELEKKYFGLAIELGEYGSHNLANYEHTFSGFYDCEKCGATVHMDQTIKHAKWHTSFKKILFAVVYGNHSDEIRTITEQFNKL